MPTMIQIPHDTSTRAPLLLTPFPDNRIAAYGGDDGILYLLPDNVNASSANAATPVEIRKYDDCIRALAASPDGKRVAVGFDDGSSLVYAYDDYVPSSSPHPFLSPDTNNDDESFSQRETSSTTCYPGPRVRSPVRQMAFDPRGKYLAVVSEDGVNPLIVCDVSSSHSVSATYLGEESAREYEGGGARSVSYDNAGTKLATLGMDGRFVVWSVPLSADDPKLEWETEYKDVVRTCKKEAGEGMGSDSGDRASRLIWARCPVDREAVLLPGKGDVQFRLEGKWNDQKFVSTGERRVDEIVCYARKDDRFVSGGRDGRVFLWEMGAEEDEGVAGELVGEVEIRREGGVPSTITSLVWVGDVIYVGDDRGVVCAVDAKGDFVKKNRVLADVEEIETLEMPKESESGPRRLGDNDEFDDDDDLFNEAVDAVGEKQAETEPTTAKKTNASKFIDDEAEDDDDATADLDESKADDAAQSSPDKQEIAYEDFTQPDPQDNADDAADVEEDMFHSHDDPIDLDPNDTHPTAAFPPQQPAFAPSSTPIAESRRILCWNHIGVVTSHPDPDSSHNLVDVAFHETAGLVGGRRPVNFTDNLGFIVGTLGEEGALFASDLVEEEDEDDFDDGEFDNLGVMSEAARKAARASRRKKREDSGKGSQVYFNRFETFGRNADKDWVVALPDGERAVGCASGKGWSGVITSRRYLRLFTNAGIQSPMIWLPGEPVTIVGRDRFVGVFYHRSATPMQDGTQLLGYAVFDGIHGTSIASGEVSAISSGASLTWAGFTESCALSLMDSEGMLSMLARQSASDGGDANGSWVPMLDTVGHKKSSHDTYWPVEVHGGKLVCVLLRGGKEYPDAARRPVTTTLSLRMPFAMGVTKCGQLEELSVRGRIAINQKKLLNEYHVAQGEGDSNDAEEEYLKLSVQIDKVTLKLFMEIIKTGKFERALSLMNRLHLEKSFDIAIDSSDRMGHRKLSDKIEEMKLQRFPAVDEDDFFDDNNSLGSREKSGSNDEASVTSERVGHRAVRGISPEIHTPNARRSSRDDDASESTREESPPKASLKRKFEDNAAASTTAKRRNPFAKKTLASPAKGIMKTPPSPAKLTLSRQSTFSTKSRQKQRSGKQIM